MLASVNIFGGFLVTQRMLAMYKKKRLRRGDDRQYSPPFSISSPASSSSWRCAACRARDLAGRATSSA